MGVWAHWQVFTPELVVLLFALLAPIVATWDNERKGLQQFALTGLAGSFLLTLGSLLRVQVSDLFGIGALDFDLDYIATSSASDYGFAAAFSVNEASQVFKLVFLGVAFLAVLGSGRTFSGRAEEDYGEFYALILFATLGMMVVASAQDLIVLFLGIETASLASYLMAGFRRDKAGAEAGLKYFVIGAIASGLTLYAISLVYGLAGTTHIPSLGGITGGLGAVVIVFFLLGLGFKISSVPVHTWAPDVYYGAPPPLTAMLASSSKAMGFVAVFNVFLVGLAGLRTEWELAIAIVAATTMFVGNLIALQQTNLRRMLAYSSIAQAGYLLIAVVVATPFAVGGGILHLMVNAAMKLGAFLIVGGLLLLGVPDHIDGWKGLGRRAPFFALAMTLFLLSMAGIPPLGGFISKFVLFSSAVQIGVVRGNWWIVWLALIAVINSAISLYYYLRVIRTMYVEKGDESRLHVPAAVTTAVMVCLVFVVLVGIAPQVFIEASMDAAQALLTRP